MAATQRPSQILKKSKEAEWALRRLAYKLRRFKVQKSEEGDLQFFQNFIFKVSGSKKALKND